MISCGMDVNLQTEGHGRPIHWAALLGNVNVVKVLQKNGAIMESLTKSKMSPFTIWILLLRSKGGYFWSV